MLADNLGAYLGDVWASTIPGAVSCTVLLLAQRALGAADVARGLGPGPCPDASTQARDGHVLFTGNKLLDPGDRRRTNGSAATRLPEKTG
eukprot:637476-Pyramimonas_sp.AAC.1